MATRPKAAPGTTQSGTVYGEARHGAPSQQFDLAGTETLALPKKILVNDGRSEVPPHMPRLVRVRSWDLPFGLLVRQGFGHSGKEVQRFEVAGGLTTGRIFGECCLIAYGAVELFAFAINSRAVVKAEAEIIPGIAHVPTVPSLSDQISVAPANGSDPGAWAAVGALAGGWQPGGRPRLDIVTSLGAAVEFGFWDSQSSPVLVSSFGVAGVLPGGTMHPAPYKLMARHPGGDSDTRTAIATWSRGVG